MSTVIETMPQLVLTAPGQAQWTDVPVPTLTGDVDALVRPLAVATCDLDTSVNAGRLPLPLPYALGHEFVAEVVEVGSSVATVRPGDVVAVPFQINCGTCARCRRGLTNTCDSVARGAAYGLSLVGCGDWGAAMSERVRVPFADAMLLPLPAGVSPAVAASLDNIPDAYRTVAPYLDGVDDRRVLVVGGASIGLYAVAIARALGAEVTYVDSSAHRNPIAAGLGASLATIDDKVGRFPITVSTNGTREGLVHALRSTEPGGVCTDTGIFIGDVALPLGHMYTSGVTFVTARVCARTDMPPVLDLIASGRLDPSVVTAVTAGWDEAPAAWSRHRGKLVVVR
jgi:threonine dehydrogenase-like Zn-dependent dehydrogenase